MSAWIENPNNKIPDDEEEEIHQRTESTESDQQRIEMSLKYDVIEKKV